MQLWIHADWNTSQNKQHSQICIWKRKGKERKGRGDRKKKRNIRTASLDSLSLPHLLLSPSALSAPSLAVFFYSLPPLSSPLPLLSSPLLSSPLLSSPLLSLHTRICSFLLAKELACESGEQKREWIRHRHNKRDICKKKRRGEERRGEEGMISWGWGGRGGREGGRERGREGGEGEESTWVSQSQVVHDWATEVDEEGYHVLHHQCQRVEIKKEERRGEERPTCHLLRRK